MTSQPNSQFYKRCLKEHGYTSLDTDSDVDKSQSDEELRNIKPPPMPYENFKDRIIKVDKERPLPHITKSYENNHFHTKEDLNRNNCSLATHKTKTKKKRKKKSATT
ncbi:hypothetical protein Trydic_g756 [Trypoxylus dichotomus]